MPKILKMRRSFNEEAPAPPANDGSKPIPSLQNLRIKIIPNRLGDKLARLHHYLHRARTGRRLSYGIFVLGELEGFITYAYSSTNTAVKGVPGDEVLEFARLFLFHNLPHMASRCIGITRRWVRRDWIKHFPSAKLPRVLVSWSDTTRHEGTIYRAAGFTFDGISQCGKWGDRSKSFSGSRKEYADSYHLKKRWIYWWPAGDEISAPRHRLGRLHLREGRAA